MIAEIYGKISRSSSNLSELSEDELTGNFFGQLRYIPFNEGLKPILKNAVFPLDVAYLFDSIDIGFWSDKIEFWPYDKEGELDAYIEFDNIVVGIEVKYTSGLSSDDDIDYSTSNEKENLEKSRNQLQRESRIITRKAVNKRKIILLVGDALSCVDIYTNINKRNLLLGLDVSFGYITWQSILRELRKLNLDNQYSALIISDLIYLLKRKGFEQFYSMELNMPYLVSSDKYYWFDYAINSIISFENVMKINVREDYYEFK